MEKIEKNIHAGGPKHALVTIVARNYLGMGLSFAESAKKHHPEVQVFIYVMDDTLVREVVVDDAFIQITFPKCVNCTKRKNLVNQL